MKRRFIPVMGLAALVLAVVLTAGTLTLTPSMANEDNGFTERSLKGIGEYYHVAWCWWTIRRSPLSLLGPFPLMEKASVPIHSQVTSVGRLLQVLPKSAPMR